MRDFLGVLLEVDDDVVLLKTPIVGEHTFKIGKVKKISSKKVLVEIKGRPYRWSNEECIHEVWRYPEQLIQVDIEVHINEEH
ncbi:hypothetical protein Bestia_00100 [Acinetobacter phage Bestia]|nr:hypothetical protein Bestia_00100 [Acinetobacter phage Bestia]